MSAAAAVFFGVLMAGLTAFQLALIAGAPLGHFAWGGQDRILPTRKRVGSATSVLLYATFTVIVLQRADLLAVIPWPGVDSVATWVLTAYFTLGIVLNALSRSRVERWTMVPLSAILAVTTTVVALS